jgi:hypothetical protein
MKKSLSRSHSGVLIVGFLFFVFTVDIPLTLLGNHLAYHWINPFLGLCVFLVYGAAVFAVCIPVTRAVNRRRYAKLEALRKAGILPERERITDADVIRLAASGKRREASLAFWELHPKSTVPFANYAVGIIDLEPVDICFAWTMLGSAILLIIGEWFHLIPVSKFLLYLSIFIQSVLILFRYWRRNGLRYNRAMLAAGRYPDVVLRVFELQEHPKPRRCFFRRSRSE